MVAVSDGNDSLESKLKLLIVISRPRTTMFLLATRTKRFIRWKKSARSKKLPSNSKSSGTVSSAELVCAGAPDGVAPGVVDVVVSVAPVAAALPFDSFTALPALWAAPPGALCAGGPAPAGPRPPLVGGVVVAGAVPVAEPAAVRSPVWMLVNLMPVPRA